MSEVVNRPAGADGQLLTDPVCGMSVPADAPLRGEHVGKTYVFCSASCLQRFEHDPSAFVGRDAVRPGDTGPKSR
jgi:P-type Cu2+ transporter